MRSTPIEHVRFLLLFLFICCLAPSCRSGGRAESRDYLELAFSDLAKDPPPPPDSGAKQRILQVVSGIRENAGQHKGYGIDPSESAALGYRAFPAIAPLLRDPDPWIRNSTIAVLFVLDRRKSTPFLVGMLLDTGKIQFSEDDVFVDTTVGRQAAGYLTSAFHGALSIPVALDELGQPLAEERAQERWWAYHLPFCSWRDTAYGKECWLDRLALYSRVPAEELPKSLKSDPGKFRYVPVVWAQTTDSATRTFTRSQAIRISLIDENFGTDMSGVPANVSRGNHVLRLIGPDSRDIVPTSRLAEFMKNAIYPPVHPQGALGWEIELSAAYDTSRPGYYRFYYSYKPPLSLIVSEYGKTLEMQFWNGHEYVNYYDFVVR
jgi:hypothetical protein